MSVQFALFEDDALPVMEDECVENGNGDFEIEPSENLPLRDARIIRKAKRPSKQITSPTEVDANGVTLAVVNGNKALLTAKNSRRPRNLKGRGQPKKGEASSHSRSSNHLLFSLYFTTLSIPNILNTTGSVVPMSLRMPHSDN